jgi:hypothetical protein
MIGNMGEKNSTKAYYLIKHFGIYVEATFLTLIKQSLLQKLVEEFFSRI